jgi:hypothetical protein
MTSSHDSPPVHERGRNRDNDRVLNMLLAIAIEPILTVVKIK